MAVSLIDAGDGVRLTIYNSPSDCVLEFGTAREMSDWAAHQFGQWASESSIANQIAAKQGFNWRAEAFQHEMQRFTALKRSLDPLLSNAQPFNSIFSKDLLVELGEEIDRGALLVHGHSAAQRILSLKDS